MEKTTTKTALRKKEKNAKKTISSINEPLIRLWDNKYDEIWNNA